jgi:hypothetical protein
MSLYETQANVGLFYLLWFAIMYVESMLGMCSLRAARWHPYSGELTAFWVRFLVLLICPSSYAVTTPKATRAASKMAFLGLVAVRLVIAVLLGPAGVEFDAVSGMPCCHS